MRVKNLKIGKRFACDTCGKVENSKLIVTDHPIQPNKHICEGCKQDIYLNNISAIAKKKSNTRMV
jgi:MinD superfamily P-loop ATPase